MIANLRRSRQPCPCCERYMRLVPEIPAWHCRDCGSIVHGLTRIQPDDDVVAAAGRLCRPESQGV